MKALTLKFEVLSKPIYKETADLISGARGVTDEEVLNSELLTEEEKKELEA